MWENYLGGVCSTFSLLPGQVHCCTCALPHHTGEKGDFVYVLELLNQKGHLAFFELQKDGHKANNA